MRAGTVLAAAGLGVVLIVLSAALAPSLVVIAAVAICGPMVLVGYGHEVAR